MIRDKKPGAYKGQNAGGSYVHIYQMAVLQSKREWFMSPRKLRVYWHEPNAALYGPLSLMTRWLEYREIKALSNRHGRK